MLGDPGLKISMWKTGEDRKKEKALTRKKEKEHTRKKRDGIRTTELNRRDQVTAAKSWPSFHRECGWKDGDRGGLAQSRNSQGGREEEKHAYREERKTRLTLTGLLMEGVMAKA